MYKNMKDRRFNEHQSCVIAHVCFFLKNLILKPTLSAYDSVPYRLQFSHHTMCAKWGKHFNICLKGQYSPKRVHCLHDECILFILYIFLYFLCCFPSRRYKTLQSKGVITDLVFISWCPFNIFSIMAVEVEMLFRKQFLVQYHRWPMGELSER